MIEEKYVEAMMNGLLEKGFDGQFLAPGTEESDIKTCFKSYLDSQPVGREPHEVFPVLLCTFIDGDRKSENYTQCILELDYNKDHGLYLSGLQAFRVAGGDIEMLNINDIIWGPAFIPSAKRINALKFEKSAVKGPVHPTWLDAALPIVSERQMKHFVSTMKEKGYKADFFAKEQASSNLEATISYYLGSRLRAERTEALVPFKISTSLEEDQSITFVADCHFMLDIKPGIGVKVLNYIPIRWDWERQLVLEPARPIRLNSIEELPERKQVKRMAERLLRNEDRRRRRKL